MNNTIAVPSLSPSGWVTNPTDKADLLFSHFFESEKSQTFLYGDNVTSLQWLLQQYGGDINTLLQQVTTALERYLSRHYDLAVVTVTTDAADIMGSSATLSIHCSVTENGTTYSIGKLLELSNTKIKNIINIINNG